MSNRIMERLRGAAAFCLLCCVLWGTAYADGELIPCGEAVGIRIDVEGVLVADTNEVETINGAASPAREAGVRPGDVILAVNGQRVADAAGLSAVVADLRGEAELTLLRGGKSRSVTVKPAEQTDGSLRLGLWLKDGVTGVGTLTYIDPENGRFGALGHGVNDLSAGALLPVEDGGICRARIVGVNPGRPGAPGELAGQIDADIVVGQIVKNTDCGIFGTVSRDAFGGTPIPVADASRIHSGAATILTCVSGGAPREYAAEITLTGGPAGAGRDLMVRVTDPALLAATGGIVQGMSGSPILQDGQFIGAVTHVLVGDPTRGYGILIGNMLSAAGA